MVLAHILAALRRFFNIIIESAAETSEMRRTMALRFPHMEE
jgi:hypothetical protein